MPSKGLPKTPFFFAACGEAKRSQFEPLNAAGCGLAFRTEKPLSTSNLNTTRRLSPLRAIGIPQTLHEQSYYFHASMSKRGHRLCSKNHDLRYNMRPRALIPQVLSIASTTPTLQASPEIDALAAAQSRRFRYASFKHHKASPLRQL